MRMTGFFPEGYGKRDLLIEELQAKVDAGRSLDSAEEHVLYYMKDKSPELRRATYKHLRYLEGKASPGNWAWRKLEDEFGYCGDYTPADHGQLKEEAFA